MSHTTRQPDLEDLAAYIDGRLGDARRAAVEARLASDEGYYEVFLESVRFQRREEGERSPGEAPIPLRPRSRAPRQRRIGALVAVAAALLITVGVGLFDQPSPLDQLDASELVGIQGWNDPGWSTTRDGGGDPSRPVAAFKLGARQVDLRIALEGQSVSDARDHVLEIEDLSRILGQRNARQRAGELLALVDGESSANLPAARKHARKLASVIGRGLETSPHAGHYALGQWAEAGRLAVLSQNDEALTTVLELPEAVAGHSALDAHREELAVLGKAPDRERAGKIFTAIHRELAGSRR